MLIFVSEVTSDVCDWLWLLDVEVIGDSLDTLTNRLVICDEDSDEEIGSRPLILDGCISRLEAMTLDGAVDETLD